MRVSVLVAAVHFPQSTHIIRALQVILHVMVDVVDRIVMFWRQCPCLLPGKPWKTGDGSTSAGWPDWCLAGRGVRPLLLFGASPDEGASITQPGCPAAFPAGEHPGKILAWDVSCMTCSEVTCTPRGLSAAPAEATPATEAAASETVAATETVAEATATPEATATETVAAAKITSSEAAT
jgi:hypothetical protein